MTWIACWGVLEPAPNLTENPARVVQHGVGFGLICLGIAALERTKRRALVVQHDRPASSQLDIIASALGDWSYGLYLIHIPIILAVTKALLMTSSSLGNAWVHVTGLICFAACLLACWLFHAHLERPLVRHVHRMLMPASRR